MFLCIQELHDCIYIFFGCVCVTWGCNSVEDNFIEGEVVVSQFYLLHVGGHLS